MQGRPKGLPWKYTHDQPNIIQMYPMYNETPWPKLTAKSVNMQNDRAATLLHVYPTNALDVAARPSAARTPIGRTVLEHGRAPVKFRTSKRHRILADHVMSEGYYSEQLETTKKQHSLGLWFGIFEVFTQSVTPHQIPCPTRPVAVAVVRAPKEPHQVGDRNPGPNQGPNLHETTNFLGKYDGWIVQYKVNWSSAWSCDMFFVYNLIFLILFYMCKKRVGKYTWTEKVATNTMVIKVIIYIYIYK